MQSDKQTKPSSNDRPVTTITVTVKLAGETGSAAIDLAEYEFVKQNSDIDLIYDTIEKLTLELQRGIQYKYMMIRSSLTDQKNWVVVLPAIGAHHFIDFKDALKFNSDNGGSLMTKEFYETGYQKQ